MRCWRRPAPSSRKTASRCMPRRRRAAGWRSGEIFDGLATASIDRAVGHPISQWSPLTDAGTAAAPAAERDADAALHRARERRPHRARRAADQLLLAQRHRRAAAPAAAAPAPRRTVADALRTPRPARRRRRLGVGLAGRSTPGRWPTCWPPASGGAAVDAHAVRRPQRAALRASQPRGLGALGQGPVQPADARPPCSRRCDHADHRQRHPAAQRLGARAGRRASAAGAALRGARRAAARTNSTTAWRACCRPTTLRGTREAAVLLADAIRDEQAPVHRRRLRLRRRDRLRGRRCAACGCWARARRATSCPTA